MPVAEEVGRKILVVDDSPVICLQVQSVLGQLGIGKELVRTASTGEKAVEQFHEQKPDVVFMDIRMPGMDGEEAAKMMLWENPNVKIVIITGLPEGDPKVGELISFGAFYVLRKPLRTEEIQRVLRLIDEVEGRAGRIR